jgi:hypothetical protein
MKKTLLLLVLVSTFNATQAQVPSSCTIPQLLANEYKRDIVQLATKRLFDLQSPDTNLVRIPQIHIDSISEGLAAIFNATSIPERDSVFNLYCVHNKNGWPGDYAGFLVQVDTSYSWTNAWQNLITTTGDPLMDTILTRYNLTITNFYNWTFGNYALLSTDSSWNSFALIDSFLMVTGVLAAEQNSLIGVAGKISYSKIGNIRYYDFDFEFQDCFDGCDAYKRWTFKVNPDCSVEYLGFVDWCFWGVGQCPIPAPINCNTLTSVIENNLEKVNCIIFPNPTNGKFQFEVNGLEFGKNSTLEIYNLQGEIIYQSAITNPKSEIDLSNHTNGIYFVKIYDGQTILTKKIVIQ